MLRENLTLITTLKDYPNIYSHLSLDHDNLIIQTNSQTISIDLNATNLQNIFNENLKNNLSNLTIDDFGKILEIESKKEEILPTKTIEEEKKSNPRIKNFKVIKKVREDGSTIEYPYYIDEYNQLHILFNYANTNILNEYQKLFISLGGNVTARNLYDALDRKMKNINLQAIYTPLSKDISESAKLEVNAIEKEKNDERVYANLEQGIYQRGNNLYTFNAQNNGLNKDSINTESEEKKEATYTDDFTSISKKEDLKGKDIEAETTNKEETKIISEEEYYLLITYTNSQEKPEIGLFESFIEDTLKYEEYISPEILGILNRYQSYMANLENKGQATQYELEALNRYHAILERIEQKKQTFNKENALIRVRKLQEQYPKAGYSLIYYILFSIILSCFLFTIIMVIK
ncbi:MAG TPA: hypothetical protein IAB49_03800 [Candidatus Caccenecus avistercoris]|nr:hypothetical protein [Candidatus Caccenecus avistercoris]